MEIELVLNSEAAEPGTAAVVRNGKPVFKVNGEEMELDYPSLRAAHSQANEEAKLRREALAQISKSLGLEVDVRSQDGLNAVLGRVSNWTTDSSELAKLRAMREAGELDQTADDKVKNLAASMNQDRINSLTSDLESAKAAQNKEKSRADAATVALANEQRMAAFRAFYDRSAETFAEGSLETFLTVASQYSENGYRWRPIDEKNATGISTLVLMDDSGTIKKGPDGVTPMSLKSWADNYLRNDHPIIFKPAQGGPPGANPTAGVVPNKSVADMTPAQVDEALRARMSAAQ